MSMSKVAGNVGCNPIHFEALAGTPLHNKLSVAPAPLVSMPCPPSTPSETLRNPAGNAAAAG